MSKVSRVIQEKQVREDQGDDVDRRERRVILVTLVLRDRLALLVKTEPMAQMAQMVPVAREDHADDEDRRVRKVTRVIPVLQDREAQEGGAEPQELQDRRVHPV